MEEEEKEEKEEEEGGWREGMAAERKRNKRCLFVFVCREFFSYRHICKFPVYILTDTAAVMLQSPQQDQMVSC
ncbi:hypothetical protein E2C01_053757 [Portunus trituberculatus]|uniref:Uncharacterized protein n=1 Tax=Portunus trituberculatus TaxID=210409 RepID=A0A5B7GQ25_PORTR|nr:hypothetical protein [Portunus trituberculatus]